MRHTESIKYVTNLKHVNFLKNYFYGSLEEQSLDVCFSDNLLLVIFGFFKNPGIKHVPTPIYLNTLVYIYVHNNTFNGNSFSSVVTQGHYYIENILFCLINKLHIK